MRDTVAWEVHHAIRRLARSPAFTIGVVLSLAIGIGANLTTLSVVDDLLFRPPAHIRDVGRVVDVRLRTYPDYLDLRDHARSFTAVAAYAPRPYTLMETARYVPVTGVLASWSLFQVLGVRPAAGRFFDAKDDRPGGPHVLVLGYDLWQRQFGATPGAVGSTVRIAGDLYTIIGVAPDGFTGARLAPADVFLPITTSKFDAGREALVSRDYSWLHVVARLAPGTSRAAAQAEARLIYTTGNPGDTGGVNEWWGGRPADVRPLTVARRDFLDANIDVSLWLAALATAVLTVACANVAGLLLARSVRARTDLAVRAALGAERLRLAAAPLAEGTLLALISGIIGVVLSRFGGNIIRALLLADIVAAPPPLDVRMLVTTAIVTVVAVLLCGVWPALHATRGGLARELASGPWRAPAHRLGARRVLVAGQLALTLMLMVGAALFVLSVRNARALDIGMALDQVVVAKTDLAGADYTPERERAVLAHLIARVSALPGVRSVGVTGAGVVPGIMNYSYSVPGRDSSPAVRALPREPGYSAVTPGFFETVGTPIVLGRGFTDADWTRRVIIVSEPFARLYWPDDNPIGRCVKIGESTDPCAEVIGVARARRAGPNDTTAVAETFVLLGSVAEPPKLMRLFPAQYVAVRLDGSPSRVVPAIQRVLQELLPDVPNAQVKPALTLFDRSMRSWRLGANVFTGFGIIALAVALIGVYATIGYSVAERSHEVGIRKALGATSRDIALLITGEAAHVAVAGALAGVALAVVVARAMAALLFGISPLSPWIYAAGGLALVGAALLASAIPAWRAGRVAPADALRVA